MLLAQGTSWRAELGRSSSRGAIVVLTLVRDGLPPELEAARELRIELPLARWNKVMKHVESDRKLLGGLLLDSANPEDALSPALAHDAVWLDLAGVSLRATARLIAKERLVLAQPEDASG